MNSGLNRARILVTRPAAQAENLSNLIAQHGGMPIRFPTLEIVEERPDPGLLSQATASDWLIFTSTNAVDFAIKAFGGKMPVLRKFKIAAVGAATADALRQSGWPVDCVPASEFNSEGLLAEPELQALAGMRCVIVRGIGGREKLAESLRNRGAEVIYLEVYSRRQPVMDSSDLRADIAQGRLDAVTITSVEALQNLLAMLDGESIVLLKSILLVVMSERIGQAAEDSGFKQIAVSAQPTDAAILENLTTLLNGENSGRSN
ncbi:Uroporphyrinogen-III synthase (EC 4.2.1.75) [Methylomonas albis]|uniref:Uroporphyrinogen-III synthase n=1 Tax=Methylomonas albis TaxID=1854563 RepID=A0ABR9D7W2_9GAMM|nr:uroporphyrinogen-III synthase [Methylomonas albis]MBD9358344.1 uroporphyrinogen-III synthase [Methylomonas albis]CAD6881735.1 Uroporphyrinogen-III synthase (EC 4.2.1.75) [Methylomonas albis]